MKYIQLTQINAKPTYVRMDRIAAIIGCSFLDTKEGAKDCSEIVLMNRAGSLRVIETAVVIKSLLDEGFKR